MIGIGQHFPEFEICGVKPGFNAHEEEGVSAFETLSQGSFPGKWKVIFFYPKDFTFICPTEIFGYAKLSQEFGDRDAVVLGGSTDNEFCKLAWRRMHPDLNRLSIWQFADNGGCLTRSLGILDPLENVAQRITYIVDPQNTVQHLMANSLNVGREPAETLRVLDALQTQGLCECSRKIGGEVLALN